MQYLTNTLLLASLAISNVAAAPVADNSAIQARQDVSDSFKSGPPNTGGNGPNVAESDYIYTQGRKPSKKQHSQNGAKDGMEHLQERDPQYKYSDDGDNYPGHMRKRGQNAAPNVEARNAYIYTQRKERRQDASGLDTINFTPNDFLGGDPAQSQYIYTQKKAKQRRSQNGAEDDAEHLEKRSKLPFEPDFGHDKREAYIYTQKKERRDNSNLQARNAYIYTQKERREPADVEARNAYIYTQKERRDPVEARNAYIYTQKERRDPADVEARNAYIYTQKERRDPVEARNAEVDYDGSHVPPKRSDEEMIDVGSA